MASGLLVVAISLLVLAQGGFFPFATCALGAVVCVGAAIAWFRKPCRSRGVPLVALLFLGMAVAYAISAFIGGASLTTLSEAGVWAACAGVAFLSAAQGGEKRAFWLKVFAWFGVATAVAGVFACAGLLPLAEGLVEARLQFTFQYANAAAAWYAVCTFLCLLSPDARQRTFAALPAAALLLTQSGGGLVVFVVCAAVVGVGWARKARWDALFQALVQGVIAALLFAGVRLTMSPVALVALVVAIAICWWVGKGASGLMERVNARVASLAMAGLLIVGAVVAFFLLSGRVAEALASLDERMFHVRDGLSLWVTQPLFGVGPDNWQYLYPYIQTAPYHTTVVHCSYIQLLLDAGIVGFAFFAAATVFGMRGLVHDARDAAARGGWAQAELLAVAFLLVHALFDFDLQFASLAFVLAALLAAPGSPMLGAKATDESGGTSESNAAKASNNAGASRSKVAPEAPSVAGVSNPKVAPEAPSGAEVSNPKVAPKAPSGAGAPNPKAASKVPLGIVNGLACLIACLPMCLTGLLCASTTMAFDLAEASGDYAASERLFLDSPLAQADVSAQSSYLVACYNQGKYDEVERIYNYMPAPTDRDVLYAALASYAENNQAQATSVLIKRLEEQPYNIEFLDSAMQLAQAYGVDPAQSGRFNNSAEQVRSIARNAGRAL